MHGPERAGGDDGRRGELRVARDLSGLTLDIVGPSAPPETPRRPCVISRIWGGLPVSQSPRRNETMQFGQSPTIVARGGHDLRGDGWS
jgi:hypothetical protein